MEGQMYGYTEWSHLRRGDTRRFMAGAASKRLGILLPFHIVVGEQRDFTFLLMRLRNFLGCFKGQSATRLRQRRLVTEEHLPNSDKALVELKVRSKLALPCTRNQHRAR